MTVYSRKEENAPKFKSLIKYRSNVKDIHDRKGRWIFYDTQFRRLKELLGNELSWDTLHNEIYLKSMGPATKSEKSDQYNPGRRTSAQNNHLRVSGYCWNYLEGRKCLCRGKFKHVCPTCDKKHECGVYTLGSCSFRNNAEKNQPVATTSQVTASKPAGKILPSASTSK